MKQRGCFSQGSGQTFLHDKIHLNAEVCFMTDVCLFSFVIAVVVVVVVVADAFNN